MNELQKLALAKAFTMLKGAGAKYIIVLPDGTEHVLGDLKLAPPEPEVKPRIRKLRVPVGTYKDIYVPILQDLQPGDIACVPYNGLDRKGMQAACTAWCSKKWGNSSFISHRTDDSLEIMRVA